MSETIILVFRDLITSPDETIKSHAELIKYYGYCWWGWWKKPIENVPIGLFERVLSIKAKIYLFDCGQYLNKRTSGDNYFYVADTDDYFISSTDAGVPSPDINKTPSYYSDRRFIVWFKFTSISGISEDVIKGHKYIDFPTWPNTAYDSYNGKYISGADELDEMRVTLWHIERNGAR